MSGLLLIFSVPPVPSVVHRFLAVPPAMTPSDHPLVDRIDALLPQTQCTKCGFDGCRPYAQALARDAAEINQCPPGGASGIAALAQLLGRTPLPLNPAHGQEGIRRLARIDETRCIGCTLCIQACPVDAIIGAPKQMHVVLEDDCTGCDLCLPPCPVDCIEMFAPQAPLPPWRREDAAAARARHASRTLRRVRETIENDARLAQKAAQKLAGLEREISTQATPDAALERKRAIVQAAIERARQRQRTTPP